MRGRGRTGIRERPFQNAMDDEVGIASDGRSEMRIFIEAQSEMAERLRRVAGLLERAKHQVGDDAFLRLAGKLRQQALVMLRGDLQVGAGKRNALLAFASMTEGTGAACFCRSGHAAVTNGDFLLMQVFDTQGVAESTSELLKLENLARIGLFMNAMRKRQAAPEKVVVDRA